MHIEPNRQHQLGGSWLVINHTLTFVSERKKMSYKTSSEEVIFVNLHFNEPIYYYEAVAHNF